MSGALLKDACALRRRPRRRSHATGSGRPEPRRRIRRRVDGGHRCRHRPPVAGGGRLRGCRRRRRQRLRRLRRQALAHGLSPHSRVAQNASFSFDPCLQQDVPDGFVASLSLATPGGSLHPSFGAEAAESHQFLATPRIHDRVVAVALVGSLQEHLDITGVTVVDVERRLVRPPRRTLRPHPG